MEEKARNKPNMVSRLPKFGTRPQGGTNSLSNGTGQPLHSQGGKGVGPVGKPNGMVRQGHSFGQKWKKGGGSPSSGLFSPMERAETQKNQGEEGRAGHRPQPLQQPPAPRELKKPSAPSAKARRSASAVTSASYRTIPQPSKPTPRGGSAQTSLGPGLHGNKLGVNGTNGRFGLGLQRAGSNPGTGGALRDGLSQSSDSLKALPVDEDSMVRSQSFTHFKQVPSPTAQPITRSFSFTRATERAKTATQGVARGGALQYSKGPVAQPAGGSAPPSNLKKSLLPTCVPGKAPALAYRLTRPSLGRQQRPLLARKGRSDQEVRGGSRDSLATSPVTLEPPSETEEAPPPEGCLAEPEVTCAPEPSTRYMGEVLEDMSISSASSLERNDTSEEYLDDFDNLGDGGGLLLFPAHDGELHQSQQCADDNAPANSPSATPTRTRHCSFLTDGVDWAEMGLTDAKEGLGVPCCRGSQAGSPEVDFPHGSSLDLSPSDSSGGTYMWDEEGLEPLGTIAHPCGSYDSDLNSLDILNNLDNLESCDLEDDDLMLDVDLAEDLSLHSDADGMSHFEHADRGGRQGLWRRRQHRWSGSDHFHNDHRGGSLQPFDGHLGPGLGRGGARELQAVVRGDSHTEALDELTLSHMAEDCSSVKSQLLKLKMLLQVEDGGTIQDALDSGILSPEPMEDAGNSLRVEELLREVEELKEELKGKEKTIAQMTQQVAVLSAHTASCQCQQRRAESSGDGQTNQDKATQTPGRAHGPPVLQPTSRWPSERLPQERLAKTVSTVDPSDIAMAAGDDGQPRDRPCPTSCQDASARPAPGSDKLSLLLSSRLRQSADKAAAAGPESPARTEGDPCGGRPRVLQSLRLHKKVSVPTLSQEGSAQPAANPANPMPGSAALLKKKQLPPPTRGLPCFSSGPQASGLARAPTVFGLPRPPGPREPGAASLKAGGPTSTNPSRLPKPKIH